MAYHVAISPKYPSSGRVLKFSLNEKPKTLTYAYVKKSMQLCKRTTIIKTNNVLGIIILKKI